MGIWKSIKKGWMVFAEVVGRVQTTVMLSIVYHLAVGPLSVFSRLTGRDVMSLGPESEAKLPTYSVSVKRISSTLERAKQQF